ncbi:hypothetical protein KFU94_36570 [Chloroflexi bacterium TSY]|nr:hypothetical protein [Chloroflexi bacterium TSY]
MQGFWSHLFRFRLQKTTYFISENRPNLTQKLDIDRQICIYVNCFARILSQNLKFGSTEYIKHFHTSENDRGTVGTGQVNWSGTFQALDDVGYDGWLVVESFNAVIPELAGATCIWRPLADSPNALAADSVAYLSKTNR